MNIGWHCITLSSLIVVMIYLLIEFYYPCDTKINLNYVLRCLISLTNMIWLFSIGKCGYGVNVTILSWCRCFNVQLTTAWAYINLFPFCKATFWKKMENPGHLILLSLMHCCDVCAAMFNLVFAIILKHVETTFLSMCWCLLCTQNRLLWIQFYL